VPFIEAPQAITSVLDCPSVTKAPILANGRFQGCKAGPFSVAQYCLQR